MRYVTDDVPGIRRRRAGRGFAYIGPDGRPVRDDATLRRIRSLAIPPAWTDVWICPDPQGHLQATGRDRRGRKQYRYHPQFRAIRDAVKFDRLIAFARALPAIRQRLARDLALPGVPREKVLATVVQLLDQTHLRIGNDEYRRANHSYGLTTLRDRHANVQGSTIRFHFRGKHGKEHTVTVRNRRLARIVKRCQELPGQRLFQYVDEAGVRHDVGSEHVNEYLRKISGGDFTTKDFRTWAGTVLAARLIREAEPCASVSQGRQVVTRTIEQVAAALGNSVAVCRKCYVHPAVLDAYLWGQDVPASAAALPPEPLNHGLSEDEQAALQFLLQQAAAPTPPSKTAAPRAAGRGEGPAPARHR